MKNVARHISACVCTFMLLVSLAASAQDVTKQQNRKAQLEKEIKLLDSQISGIKKQSTSATTRLELLRQNITNRKALVAESEAIIKNLNF